MITGPNLGILFDTYLIYNYMSQLEKGHPRLAKREDVVWYLIFICSTIMVGAWLSIALCLPPSPLFILLSLLYCPDSDVLHLPLSRFLKMRKSTPAFLVGPISQGPACGAGMVGCLYQQLV